MTKITQRRRSIQIHSKEASKSWLHRMKMAPRQASSLRDLRKFHRSWNVNTIVWAIGPAVVSSLEIKGRQTSNKSSVELLLIGDGAHRWRRICASRFPEEIEDGEGDAAGRVGIGQVAA